MEHEDQHLAALKDIRSMMERSSRFISLNGAAGILMGLFAIGGVAFVYRSIHHRFASGFHSLTGEPLAWHAYFRLPDGTVNTEFITMFLNVAALVLVLSVAVSCFLTIRKAKKARLAIWDATAKRLLMNLLIPLVAGGLFCAILASHELFSLIVGCTLLFYGLALINSSKYTFPDIRYLGLMEVTLGLVATLFVDYALICWAAGFGILHIVYGTLMYYKYERSSKE